ncbi:hypothetical protein D770_10480 [Flammeovirgaceae bacterium 311]|nr:hypothetical protein D770_10480 [Flammeovirgaceae bacterium 311]
MQMKKFLIVLLMMISLAAYAQEGSKNSFGVTAGAGSATVLRANLDGGPNLDLERGFDLGANYYRQIGGKLKFETGLFYHYNRLIQTPAPNPDVPRIATHYDVHLLYLPAFLRLNLSKNFFVNGGVMADIDMSNNMGLSTSRALSSQSGLGIGLGIGGEVAVFNTLYLQLNPYLNLHGALLVQRESYPGRILDAGIKLGIRTR